MLIQWIKKVALVAACVVSFGAQAAVITDTVNVNKESQGAGLFSWQHDLTDDGFALGSALDAQLTIEFTNNPHWSDFLDTATIVIGIIDFQDGELFNWVPSGTWVGDIGATSLEILNAAGKLTVKVITTGFFYIGDSTLTVNTADSVSVPESSSLMLFALGLLGLVALRKRKAA